MALFGVMVVNYATVFRGPLLDMIGRFHTRPELVHRIADWIIGVGMESKAFAIYALLFGAGMAAWHESGRPLLRRMLVLLVIGALHMAWWNGDILLLYAVCGLVLSVRVNLSPAWLAIFAIALFAFGMTSIVPDLLPHDRDAWIASAVREYQGKDPLRMAAFRARETEFVIAPLLLGTAPRVLGLMLCGMALWKTRVLLRPREHVVALKWALAIGAFIGIQANAFDVYARGANRAASELGILGLATAYASGLLLLFVRFPVAWLSRVGRLSLTGYLGHTILGAFLFYGFGLGLFDRVGTATAAAMAVAVYALLALVSKPLLARGQGPMERLWRRFSGVSASA